MLARRCRRHYSMGPMDLARLEPFLDFKTPSKWYPAARLMKRQIVCHVGPTNSGKTHSAVQEFASGTGRRIYCAPLRLLAIEMYERLNKSFGVPCSLRTGEITCGPAESATDAPLLSSGWQDFPATACTVEMTDINTPYEISIIDEIQMLTDPQRGWAFTQALLGLQSRKLFLCGEEAALPLIERICQETGDSLEVNHFKRLSPLFVSNVALVGDLKRVQPGDCVVTFSRRQIFDLKERIERSTNKKCAVIYGSLPMGFKASLYFHLSLVFVESRSQQARMFNEKGSGHNVLVASDAIGMGLNLNIRRIVFETMSKYNGSEQQQISPNQVKQIAGRAGRFGTVHEGGEVTALSKKDLAYLKECMARPNEPCRYAGLLPSADHVVNLSAAFPALSLPEIIELYSSISQVRMDRNYFMCHFQDMKNLALILEGFKRIPMKDRFQLACAPVKASDEYVVGAYRSLLADFNVGRPAALKMQVPGLNERKPEISLKEAESVYRSLDLYLWLATKFPSHFPDIQEARKRREACGQLVDEALERICKVKAKKKAAIHSVIIGKGK